MSNFEFLTVLLAIIIGIGISHLLLSTGRFLGEAKSLNLRPVHMVWTFNIILVLVGYWWWINALRSVEVWSFPLLLLLFMATFLWCLLAALLYPPTVSPDYDLKTHFEKKRIPFFSILIILSFLDPLTAFAVGIEQLLALGVPYFHLMAVCLVGGIAGIRFSNERFQLALAVYWGLSLLGAQFLVFPAIR